MPVSKIRISSMTAVGVVFTLIALMALTALVRFKSIADTNTNALQSANVVNTPPTIDSLQVLDGDTLEDVTLPNVGFTPKEGQAKNIVLTGTITDLNGFSDFKAVNCLVFRSDKMDISHPSPCSADNNDCYKVENKVLTQTGPTTATFTVNIPIAYYADPTDSVRSDLNWVAVASPLDKSGTWSLTSVNFEMNSLAAISVAPSMINYGEVALGAVSDQKVLRFYNQGNRDINTLVKSDHDMVSSLGAAFSDIPSSNARYSASPAVAYDSAAQVSTSDVSFPICLPQQTDDNGGSPNVASYFRLKMPSSGVNGTYTNTLTFTADPTTGCVAQVSTPDCNTFPDDPACSVPSVSSLNPSSVTAGGSGFTLTVNGANFKANTIIMWGRQQLATTFVSSAQLTAPVTASMLNSVKTVSVMVYDPDAGSMSNMVNLEITGSNSNPALEPGLDYETPVPKYAVAGGETFTLDVHGQRFQSETSYPHSIVLWNGQNLETTYISDTELTAVVPAELIANPGTATITVYNPHGSYTSDARTFVIYNQGGVPIIDQLSPSSVVAGTTNFTLHVSGTIASNDVIRWNGTNLETVYNGSGENGEELTALIPDEDLVTAGTASITLYDPTSDNTSFPSTFTITSQ